MSHRCWHGGGSGGTRGAFLGTPAPDDLMRRSMPPEVEEAFRRNPALSGAPPSGLELMAVNRGSAAPSLHQRRCTPFVNLAGFTADVRAEGVTYRGAYTILVQPADELWIAEVIPRPRDAGPWGPRRAESFITTAISAEGDFWPLRPGAKRRIAYTTAGYGTDEAGPPRETRREKTSEVLRSFSPVQLWREIALRRIPAWGRHFTLAEPSFLQGIHHEIRTQETGNGVVGPDITLIVSQIYGLPILVKQPSAWSYTTYFGPNEFRIESINGEGLVLNSLGQERLRESRAVVESVIADTVARGAFVSDSVRVCLRSSLWIA